MCAGEIQLSSAPDSTQGTAVTISDISSLASSIAVMATLVFLVIQTRQTNRNQKALMQQGRAARTMDIMLKQADPDVALAMDRALRSDMTLVAPQVQTVNRMCIAMFWSFEDSFLQHQAGLLDEAGWATELATLRNQLTSPPVRAAWKIWRVNVTGLYRGYVDSLMNEIKPQRAFDEVAVWKSAMTEALAEATE
jgi:hypothetical protein